MEEEVEEGFKIEPNDIWNIIIMVIIGIIIGTVVLMYLEYDSAKKFCSETDGEFNFEFPNKYFCSETPLIKYSDGWDYDREINFTSFTYKALE